MDRENDQILTDLRDKIKMIINLYEGEKEKNRQIIAENEQLKNKLIEIKNEKEELIVGYNNLKLAKQLDASIDNTHDAKLKVNRIVREIDKCIALLNK